MSNHSTTRNALVTLIVLFVTNAALGQKLYWTQSGVHRANLDGTSSEDLLGPGVNIQPYVVAVDSNRGKICWSNLGVYDGLYGANIDGSNIVLLAPAAVAAVGEIRGLAIDPQDNGRHIYLTAIHPHGIYRYDAETDIIELVLGLNEYGDPSDVEFDPTSNQLYWNSSSIIFRANTDGTGVQEIVDDFGVKSLALNPTDGKLYWHGIAAIKRSNLDGSNVETLLAVEAESGTPPGIQVDPVGGKIYWNENYIVYRADLDGQNKESISGSGFTGKGNLFLDQATGHLYLAAYNGQQILRSDLDGSNVFTVVASANTGHRGIALDTLSRRYYWSMGAAIFGANYDGSNVQSLVALQAPIVDLAYSLATTKLYWTDSYAGFILQANVDGSNVEALNPGSLFFANTLDVDDANAKIYWTVRLERDEQAIMRADMDGTNIETLPLDIEEVPQDVAVDSQAGKLYVAEAQGIWQANLDGSNIVKIIDNIYDVKRVELDRNSGKIYWKGQGGLFRANTDGTDVEFILSLPAATLSMALDTSCTTYHFGDVNFSGIVNLDDILCTVGGFSNAASCPTADLSPCGGDGVVNLDDILSQLAAFAGSPSCPDPCE